MEETFGIIEGAFEVFGPLPVLPTRHTDTKVRTASTDLIDGSVLPSVYGRRSCLPCCWSQSVEQLT